jgi:RimJ/RimL family protein N-acetyltransferase
MSTEKKGRVIGTAAEKVRIELRSLSDVDVAEVHRQQNSCCPAELADFFDAEPPYLPLPLEKFKSAVAEYNRKDRTYLVGVFTHDGHLAGLAMYGAEFDATWPWLSVLIFPEHRRKGFGGAAAEGLIAKAFGQTNAHSLCSHVPGWSEAGLAFAPKVGLKPAGRSRRSYVVDGKFVDGFFFDMLRSEYKGTGGGA